MKDLTPAKLRKAILQIKTQVVLIHNNADHLERCYAIGEYTHKCLESDLIDAELALKRAAGALKDYKK